MNRIILAYCHDNAEVAESIEQQLSRIGIPFEHITDQPAGQPDNFGKKLLDSEDPVVLIVTENLLKSRFCMSGLLTALQRLVRNRNLLAVVADGKTSPDGGTTFNYVETHFDRMGHALQYMNFWQTAWLDLSSRHQHASAEEKDSLESEMNDVHLIANEIGEIIGALREAGHMTLPQLEADHYAAFFRQFGLQEWHEQYRRIATSVGQDDIPPIPKTAPQVALAETPVVTGPLAPEPADEEEPLAHIPAQNGQFRALDDLLHEMDAVEEPDSGFPALDMNLSGADLSEAEEEPEHRDIEAEIDQSIRDAWFWLDKGHSERGIELFKFAMEQYPESERLKNEYHTALEKLESKTEVAELEETSSDIGQPVEPAENEAKSYELMGDMAAQKGDYLFAKYCWDRATEIDPNYPGIYRKLGLMTSEHLQDYRETAIHYLNMAIQANPDDAELHLALAGSTLQNGDSATAEKHYTQAVMLDPTLRTPGHDEQFHQTVATPAKPAIEITKVPEPPAAETAPSPKPVAEKRELLTVLITGATSGIGRATAEIFARNGHRVILTGRRVERLVLLKTQFEEEFHTDVLMLPFDVRDQGAVHAALENLPESWQNIDILINNAGLAKGLAPIHEGNLDHWETMIDTNLKGLLYVTRAVAPGMVARRRGHIINLGSSAGKEVYASGNVYCATKFAVDALTRAIRLDLHAHNIRVSSVSPGHVEETEFAITRFDGDEERARIYNDFQPLKAADVAEAIWFIATRPPHVNIQDIVMFGTQQASATVVDRSGRK